MFQPSSIELCTRGQASAYVSSSLKYISIDNRQFSSNKSPSSVFPIQPRFDARVSRLACRCFKIRRSRRRNSNKSNPRPRRELYMCGNTSRESANRIDRARSEKQVRRPRQRENMYARRCADLLARNSSYGRNSL